MWIPNWMYQRLPIIYFIAGVLCPWMLGNSFAAQLSAMLFITAAVLTKWWRHREKAPASVRAARLSQARFRPSGFEKSRFEQSRLPESGFQNTR